MEYLERHSEKNAKKQEYGKYETIQTTNEASGTSHCGRPRRYRSRSATCIARHSQECEVSNPRGGYRDYLNAMQRLARLLATIAFFAIVAGCATRYVPVHHYHEVERIKVVGS